MVHAPGFQALVDAALARVGEVTVAQAQQRAAAGALLIDVREQDEWAAGHLPGALYLGKGVIERDIEAHVPLKETAIILYCRGGFRSVLAADALQRMGYTNVVSMTGGYREWTAQGGPTAHD